MSTTRPEDRDGSKAVKAWHLLLVQNGSLDMIVFYYLGGSGYCLLGVNRQ